MRVQVRGPHPLRPGIQPGSPDTWFSKTAGRPVGAGARDPATPHTQPPTGITRARFGLIRFRSPLLTEYPFLQVLRCFTSLRTPRPKPVPTHDGRWVPPFGNPRIKALLAAPRGLSQPQTSFIGPVCQGIHHTPLQATHTTKVHGRKIPLANSQTTNHHTKNDHKTIETNTKKQSSIRNQQQNKDSKPLFCSRPLSSSQATTHRHADQTGTRPARRHDGHRIAPGKKPGVAIREPKSASAPPPRNIPRRTNRKPMISSTPATRPHATTAREGSHRTPNGILYSP